eukprot:1079138-Pyramimonas_sp.AAC.1
MDVRATASCSTWRAGVDSCSCPLLGAALRAGQSGAVVVLRPPTAVPRGASHGAAFLSPRGAAAARA